MEYRQLGRTGLKVSALGLGAGGFSRLGKSSGCELNESVAIVKSALDAGINLIDTAESYGTEEIVGKAISGRDRSSVILSTKVSKWKEFNPRAVEESLDSSLKGLGTDYIDVYHLHGVRRESYDKLVDRILPVMEKARQSGKIRFLGMTEYFNEDSGHVTLQHAVPANHWDVIMVGFNILNPSARFRVFPHTRKLNVGTLIMFAVRRAFSDPERLKELLDSMVARGIITGEDLNDMDPVGFLGHYKRGDWTDAAYRFCLFEPGVDVVLMGTGNPDHLKANLKSAERGPLPVEQQENLRKLFANVDSVTGQ